SARIEVHQPVPRLLATRPSRRAPVLGRCAALSPRNESASFRCSRSPSRRGREHRPYCSCSGGGTRVRVGGWLARVTRGRACARGSCRHPLMYSRTWRPTSDTIPYRCCSPVSATATRCGGRISNQRVKWSKVVANMFRVASGPCVAHQAPWLAVRKPPGLQCTCCDLGFRLGADDGNRTRILSLGS